ncbi:mitochondrial RNA pseudouridine synthase rpusd4 [Silurus asotus]|uniref:Pseudouridylate synthase RPUSD4, mitochondrial n=1 Tax=Silurus asotus TaxID=30991 RepID=A0AAD5FF46_SILAS|nr:mitochondrial RNA pseudouridine synthase rpusd4 [Silurus asotus]
MSAVRVLSVWRSRHLNCRCFVGNVRINDYEAPRGFLRLFRDFCTDEGTVTSGRKRGLKAADVAERLRREKQEKTETTNKVPVSPVQRNVAELKRFTQKLQFVHPNVFAKALSNSILYQDQNIIAINKPYGVPVYSTGGIGNSIAESLPVLAKIIDGIKGGSELHVCYNLEKDTTGILFLSRTEETAEQIHNLIRSHEAEKRYMVITVGVPVPSEGVIDIPIIEKEVMGDQHHFKMGLSPLYRPAEQGDGLVRVRAHRQAQSAVTRYKVLDSSSRCSLVELQPITGVKHQLRVHMALALACPILGDHKYADWNKLAPQKLPEGVLRRLGLEQSKTRHLPLHLHVRQITLPGVRGHTDLTVSCPLPKFFTAALKKLQIELPEKP